MSEDRFDDFDNTDLSKGVAAPQEGSAHQEDDERVKITVEISQSLARKAKTAVYFTPGLNLYDIVERGMSFIVRQMEEDRGEEFSEEIDQLSGGRNPKL